MATEEIKAKAEEKFLKEISDAMRRFNMQTSGSVTLDERIRQY